MRGFTGSRLVPSGSDSATAPGSAAPHLTILGHASPSSAPVSSPRPRHVELPDPRTHRLRFALPILGSYLHPSPAHLDTPTQAA
jgi:hypothetical protein